MTNKPTTKDVEKKERGLGPYIVHVPFAGAEYIRPEDSPAYASILADEKDMRLGGDKAEQYRKRAGLPEGRAAKPYMFHNEEMLEEARQKAIEEGRIADSEGRFWFWTEEEAANCLIHYMTLENYGAGGSRNHLRDAWPYRKGRISNVYLDPASLPFKKSKLFYLKKFMSEKEIQLEIEKDAANRKMAVS